MHNNIINNWSESEAKEVKKKFIINDKIFCDYCHCYCDGKCITHFYSFCRYVILTQNRSIYSLNIKQSRKQTQNQRIFFISDKIKAKCLLHHKEGQALGKLHSIIFVSVLDLMHEKAFLLHAQGKSKICNFSIPINSSTLR